MNLNQNSKRSFIKHSLYERNTLLDEVESHGEMRRIEQGENGSSWVKGGSFPWKVPSRVKRRWTTNQVRSFGPYVM